MTRGSDGTSLASSATMLDLQQSVALASRLRDGVAVSDSVFDRIYPYGVRWRSSTFWTPVAVAMRAAELLAPTPSTRVLDIGSGVGKLCIVGAARTGALFVGVEHREHLVAIATDAARRMEVSTARFFHRTFEQVDIETFDAIYAFNPFEENLWPKASQLDHTVELSPARFLRDVVRARRLIASARAGARIVTYHGLGVGLDGLGDLVYRERIVSDALEVWIRAG